MVDECYKDFLHFGSVRLRPAGRRTLLIFSRVILGDLSSAAWITVRIRAQSLYSSHIRLSVTGQAPYQTFIGAFFCNTDRGGTYERPRVGSSYYGYR